MTIPGTGASMSTCWTNVAASFPRGSQTRALKQRSVFILLFLTLCLTFAPASGVRAAWLFSWATRTDHHGKPAGHFATTPFPIYETNTTYTVTNDESPNGKTFSLGSLYFVDGAKADDTGDGLSLATAKKTITAAYNAAGSGNKTILIRGAHDAFNGIYTTNATETVLSWAMKAGAGDTNRYMWCGYGQERPIINAALTMVGNITNRQADVIKSSGQRMGFYTLQRLQIQNCYGDGIYIGSTSGDVDEYANVIDCFVTNCCALNTNLLGDGTFVRGGNAAVYVATGRHVWFFHDTVCHSVDHTTKMASGCQSCTVEWCLGYEAGYWPTLYAEAGFTTSSTNTHLFRLAAVRARVFDFPSDSGQCASNNILRYCIAFHGLYQGVEIRNSANMDCHHNELYNSPCFQLLGRLPVTMGAPYAQLTVEGAESAPRSLVFNCRVHDNYIHDACDTNASAWGVSVLSPGNSVYFYNNVCWSNASRYGEVWLYGNVGYTTSNRLVCMYNNTIIGNLSDSAKYPVVMWQNANWHPGELIFTNNLVIQYGTNSVGDWGTLPDHDYNLYYYPNARLGFTANAHEITGQNPLFTVPGANPMPVDPWYIAAGSPAIGAGVPLAAYATNDINAVSRGGTWDIGAYEYEPIPTWLMPATDLRETK